MTDKISGKIAFNRRPIHGSSQKNLLVIALDNGFCVSALLAALVYNHHYLDPFSSTLSINSIQAERGKTVGNSVGKPWK
jgi:hypothetical protein